MMTPDSGEIRAVRNVTPAGPLDARLARRLVTPLCSIRVTPNHLTTLRLIPGLAAAACLAQGSLAWANIGAFIFALSNFVDHTDGELARISGTCSRFGHRYDLACDALIHTLLPAPRAFEIEDVLYLFPLVTLFDVRTPFLIAAVIGAPAFALWLVWYLRRLRAAEGG